MYSDPFRVLMSQKIKWLIVHTLGERNFDCKN